MSKQETKTVYWCKNVGKHPYELVAFDDMGDLAPDSYITLGKGEAKFDVSMTDIDVLAATIAGLEKQREKIQAEAYVEVAEINNRIQSLLSITHKAEA